MLVLALGVPIARRTKKLDVEAWVDQQIIGRRLKLYEEIGPKLNDLYCLTRFIGHFREVDPPKALKHKRDLDRTMHVNRPIYSDRLFAAYQSFMDATFETYVGAGEDAKLRMDPKELKQEWREPWSSEWDRMFATASNDYRAIEAAYEVLVASFSADLGTSRRD